MGRKQEEKDVEISRAIALNEVNAFSSHQKKGAIVNLGQFSSTVYVV